MSDQIDLQRERKLRESREMRKEISRRNRAGELTCKGCGFVGHMKLLVAQGSARYRCSECKKEHRIGELI
jgi:predicted RNA-binding Zn-ribbon protein involved in translation (DUF1610 family)